jgi:hypothetical protein
VSPRALEQLAPHSPAAVAKLADDVQDTKADVQGIRRLVNAHGSRISKLEEFKRKTAEYLKSVADL